MSSRGGDKLLWPKVHSKLEKFSLPAALAIREARNYLIEKEGKKGRLRDRRTQCPTIKFDNLNPRDVCEVYRSCIN